MYTMYNFLYLRGNSSIEVFENTLLNLVWLVECDSFCFYRKKKKELSFSRNK